MSAPVVLALDLATRFGWCVGPLDGGTPLSGAQTFAAEGAPNEAVFGGAIRWVSKAIREHGVNRVVVEAPLDPRHLGNKTTRATGLRLIGLPACVFGTCYLAGCYDVREFRADKVRYSLLRQRLKKADAKEKVMWAVNANGFPTDDNDEADAIALWLYAATLHRESNA